jgi:hypothetical protein
VSGVTYEQLVEVFGAEQVARVPEECLPEGITHGPSRRFLVEVGLPAQIQFFLSLVPYFATGLGTMRDAYPELPDRIPEQARGWHRLGMISNGDLCLDGASGRVHCVSGGEATFVNRDLAGFATFLHLIRDRALQFPGGRSLDFYDWLEAPRAFMARLAAIDDAGFAEDARGISFWQQALQSGNHWLPYHPTYRGHDQAPRLRVPSTRPAPVTRARLSAAFGDADVVTVDQPEIAHEPTRRFLAEVGLPRRVGHVVALNEDFTSGLRTVAETYPGNPRTLPAGCGGLYVLGAFQSGDLCVDPVTGEVVVLTSWRAERLLLGSGVAGLAGSLLALHQHLPALRAACEVDGDWIWRRVLMSYATEPLSIRLKHVDPVVWSLLDHLWPSTLRAMDPREATAEGRVDRYAAPYPARRRAAVSDPPEVTRQALASVFDEIVRFTERQLPAGISHEPTRRFLTEVGVPTGRMTEIDAEVDRIRSVAEWPGMDAELVPPHCMDLFYLGYLGPVADALCLDGATGAVFKLPEVGGEAELVNSSLAALAHFLIEVYRAKDLLEQGEPEDYELPYAKTVERFLYRLEGVDAAACAAEDQYWCVTLSDAEAHGLG